MILKPRTLKVGATEYVWARSTEQSAQDLTSVAVSLREVDPDGVVGAWTDPDDIDLTIEGTVRAAISHTASVPGWWALDIRLVDGSELVIQRAGTFNVLP